MHERLTVSTKDSLNTHNLSNKNEIFNKLGEMTGAEIIRMVNQAVKIARIYNTN